MNHSAGHGRGGDKFVWNGPKARDGGVEEHKILSVSWSDISSCRSILLDLSYFYLASTIGACRERGDFLSCTQQKLIKVNFEGGRGSCLKEAALSCTWWQSWSWRRRRWTRRWRRRRWTRRQSSDAPGGNLEVVQTGCGVSCFTKLNFCQQEFGGARLNIARWWGGCPARAEIDKSIH